MKKIVVLGAGMVGSAIAIDLSKSFKVKIADVSAKNLLKLKKHSKLQLAETDLSSAQNIKNVIEGADLVVCAVPGFMGFETIKAIIEAGKNLVDISFFSEDPFMLDKLAKKKNVTAIVDCGVAPGLGSVILGYHNKRMKINSFECYVGGLPKKKTPPFEYKAPFSPIDVIEEYTRPARLVENNKVIVKEALSDVELLHFPNAGTLEAFNTDGLRTLLKTMKIPFMKEKTLRYPGHIEKIKVLKDAGFFKKELVKFKDGTEVSPLDLTAGLLFQLWKLKPNEKEFTVMKIIVEGIEKNRPKTYEYNLYDEFNSKTKTSSMARTTGYTCSAAVNIVLKKLYTKKGISPPEYLGADKQCFEFILSHLNKRNIKLDWRWTNL